MTSFRKRVSLRVLRKAPRKARESNMDNTLNDRILVKNKNWYVDENEADLLVCVIRFIEIGQEMPELANRSDLSPVPIRDLYKGTCKSTKSPQIGGLFTCHKNPSAPSALSRPLNV